MPCGGMNRKGKESSSCSPTLSKLRDYCIRDEIDESVQLPHSGMGNFLRDF
jgi:hypothetical protein